MACNKTVEFSGKNKTFFQAHNTLIRYPLISIPALIQPSITIYIRTCNYFVYAGILNFVFGYNAGFLVWVFDFLNIGHICPKVLEILVVISFNL